MEHPECIRTRLEPRTKYVLAHPKQVVALKLVVLEWLGGNNLPLDMAQAEAIVEWELNSRGFTTVYKKANYTSSINQIKKAG